MEATPSNQLSLFDNGVSTFEAAPKLFASKLRRSSAIESPEFPFEWLCDIAELESWRKEIHRPIYHLHKWWAQRLGSVFRAIILGALTSTTDEIPQLFYEPARIEGVVFDPFMGSGTTVGEALKLGLRAIGRDINPVAYRTVRNEFASQSRRSADAVFQELEGDTAPRIQHFYRARLPEGDPAEALYYFWVKVVPCLNCQGSVDLFSSYIFATHAYPERNPEARALCPCCTQLITLRYDSQATVCEYCGHTFNPHSGPARKTKAHCPTCGSDFAIGKAVQRTGQPPTHRMYAKLVLCEDGTKRYLPADAFDLDVYAEASAALQQLPDAYPFVPIQPGYNTNQVLGYCYTHWHQMFNDRQLLCLGLLATRIRSISDPGLRDLFTCLFSGTLEFNNMFASYKGEGTGAVRHMFAHHVLKPERTPLEANLWGTPYSSGAFSTLYKSRLLRALEYRDNPFEIRVAKRNGRFSSEKVFGLSLPLSTESAENYSVFDQGGRLYLSCGDSAQTDVASESVDAVITDPPFFDNVHYSQLADFFYVWQQHVLAHEEQVAAWSTRSIAEVQQSEPALFEERLTYVWRECHRVLKPDGLLVFTYHHSRAEGWRSVLTSLIRSGFVVVRAHPIKAEMSVAAPKHQARQPIDLDMILVCRKRSVLPIPFNTTRDVVFDKVFREAEQQITRLRNARRILSLNDARVIFMAQFVVHLSVHENNSELWSLFGELEKLVEPAINRLHQSSTVTVSGPATIC